jgi:hypothetical protein
MTLPIITISQARQGGFSSVNLPGPLDQPPIVGPWGMGWLYQQDVFRTVAQGQIFGYTTSHFKLVAFSADGSASAEITENSKTHQQIDAYHILPINADAFIVTFAIFSVSSTGSFSQSYYILDRGFYITSTTASVIDVPSAARTAIYAAWDNSWYWYFDNGVLWKSSPFPTRWEFPATGPLSTGSSDSGWVYYADEGIWLVLDSPTISNSGLNTALAGLNLPKVRAHADVDESTYGSAAVGGVPNNPTNDPKNARISPWLRVPESQPVNQFQIEVQQNQGEAPDPFPWVAAPGYSVQTARDMADFHISTDMAGPWGTGSQALGGHRGFIFNLLSFAPNDRTADAEALGFVIPGS